METITNYISENPQTILDIMIVFGVINCVIIALVIRWTAPVSKYFSAPPYKGFKKADTLVQELTGYSLHKQRMATKNATEGSDKP